MGNIIEIEGLNKSFGEVHAVRDLSFRVKEGELFAFLGRPGYLLGYIPLIAGVWLILYLPFILKNKKSTG